MKIRTIYFILIISTITYLIHSCKKSDFDLANPSTIDASLFYKTPAHAIAAVNAAYRGLYLVNPAVQNILGEEATASSNGNPFDKFNFDATSLDQIGYEWPTDYNLIYQANVCLEKIPGIDFTGYTGSNTKESLIAEAKFIRAFSYFRLIVHYGGVPLITAPPSGELTPDKVQIPRSTPDQIWPQIATDFSEAIPNLPAGWDDLNVGRVTKGAAIAYLAKAYIYQKKWTEAKTTLEQLFALKNVNKGTNNGYALLPDFNDNFNLSPDQKWGLEAVWQISNSNQIRFANGANWGGGANHEIGKFFAWVGPKPNYYSVAQFEPKDTMRLKGSITGNLSDESSIVNNKYGGMNNIWDNWEGQGKYSGVNWQLFRFAEALLYYAEAVNESGNQANAIINLNKVRNRAGVPLYPYTFSGSSVYTPITGNGTQADIRNAIKHERLVEFYCEDIHYWDLVRWGDCVSAFNAANVYQTSRGSTNDSPNWKPNKNELWPIPSTEINLNPKLTQNPGY